VRLRIDVALALPDFELAVDLDMESSSIGVFGPSGAGKTTLLEIIAGLRAADRSEIAIDGRQIGHLPARERHIGYVPQDETLFPHMSVRGNVLYGRECGAGNPAGVSAAIRRQDCRRHTEARLTEVANALGIEALLDRGVAKLSGGERRRVAIARAFMTRPAVLLLDEPLAGLDATRASATIEMLRAIQMPIVFVSHDRDEVAALCEHVIVLDRGVPATVTRKSWLHHTFSPRPGAG
jgi:molybdate transport system ATP-binding protein